MIWEQHQQALLSILREKQTGLVVAGDGGQIVLDIAQNMGIIHF